MTFSNPHYIENISKFRQMYEITGVSLKYCEFLLDNFHLAHTYDLDYEDLNTDHIRFVGSSGGRKKRKRKTRKKKRKKRRKKKTKRRRRKNKR